MKKNILLSVLVCTFLFYSCTSTPKPEEDNSSVENEKTVLENTVEPEVTETTEESVIEEPTPEIEEVPSVPVFTEIEEPKVFDLPPEEIVAINSENDQQKEETSDEILEPIAEEILEEKPAEATEVEQPEIEDVQPESEVQNQIETQNEELPSQEENTENNTIDENQETDSLSDELENNEESTIEENEQPKEPEIPVPSRSVKIKRNQYLDITYPGSGWIYMGETEKKMVYFGRKIATDNTSFTLRSRFSGTTLLHFYKNDILTGKYIDDYLEVVIDDIAASPSEKHIVAPSYAAVVPPEPNRELLKDNKTEQKTTINSYSVENPRVEQNSTNTNDSLQNQKSNTEENNESILEKNGKTVIQTTDDFSNTETKQVNQSSASNINKTTQNKSEKRINTEGMSAADILIQAQKAYDEKNYKTAFELLTAYFENSDTDIDKALYLQGQILEAKSPVQDIKSSLDAYTAIIKNYPQSPLWRKANERSMYLKRFYIDIR